MPKLAPEYIQVPMALYPITEQLDASRGIITATLQDLPNVNPENRMKLAKLMGDYGQQLGPTNGIETNEDLILEVKPGDYENASIESIEAGLYYRNIKSRQIPGLLQTTEQVIINWWEGSNYRGVTFPSDQYRDIAKSPVHIAQHIMANTRRANENNPDRMDVEGRVGRSAAHTLIPYADKIDSLDTELAVIRKDLLLPLYRDTTGWQSHFKAKNLDIKRREFDELLHDTIDTAVINLDINSFAINSLHRATASNMYRKGSFAERNNNIRGYINMLRKYVQERRITIRSSRERVQSEINRFQPFIDQKLAATQSSS